MSEQPDNLPVPSRHFIDAACDSSSPVVDCGFCGRVHFASGARSDCEADELEALRAKAKKKPDMYVEDPGNDGIGWGYIDGRQAVWNCPCRALSRYERFIWANRHRILDYLKRRTKDERAEAAKLDAEVESVLADFGVR